MVRPIILGANCRRSSLVALASRRLLRPQLSTKASLIVGPINPMKAATEFQVPASPWTAILEEDFHPGFISSPFYDP
jgi:hypothetical protein